MNDVGRQLRAGVDPADVAIRGQVPLQVRLPDRSLSDVAVFVGANSGPSDAFGPSLRARLDLATEAVELVPGS